MVTQNENERMRLHVVYAVDDQCEPRKLLNEQFS